MSVSLWDRVSLVVLAHASFRYKMPSPAHSCHTEDLHREHDPTVSRFWFFSEHPHQTKRFCQTSLSLVFIWQMGSFFKLNIVHYISQTQMSLEILNYDPTSHSSIPPPNFPGFELHAGGEGMWQLNLIDATLSRGPLLSVLVECLALYLTE